MLLNIFIFIGILVILSAFFSLSETAIFSLSSLKLHRIEEKSPRGKIVKNLLQRPTRTLSTINFGNMLVNIGISSLLATLFVETFGFGDKGLFLSIFISGILVLLLGEVFPKTFAIYLPEKLSLFCAPILNIFSKIFLPFIAIIERIVSLFSYFLGWFPRKSSFSFEELKTALLLSKRDGQISAAEEEMINYVLEFKDTWVSEAMSHRVDIHGIDIKSSQESVSKILREKKHSKFPVYDGSTDNIIGILHAKDFFLKPETDYHLLLSSPLFIPESKKIDDLLKLFLEKNEKIAIVLDEHGGTQGLVTLEDVEEEIFGEIYDEFETPADLITVVGDKTYRLYGKLPLKSVNLDLNLELPEEQDTIAGFILAQMGRIPNPQEKFYFKDLEFTIERASPKKIISIILRIKR